MLSPVCNSPRDVDNSDSGSSEENHCRGELFGVGPRGSEVLEPDVIGPYCPHTTTSLLETNIWKFNKYLKSVTSPILKIIIFVHMHMYVCTHATVHIQRSETTGNSWSSPLTTWDSGIKLRPSGFAAQIWDTVLFLPPSLCSVCLLWMNSWLLLSLSCVCAHVSLCIHSFSCMMWPE